LSNGSKEPINGSNTLPKLTIPRAEASQKLLDRIIEGERLLKLLDATHPNLADLQEQKSTWSDYNRELLIKLFNNVALAEEYGSPVGGSINSRATFDERVGYVHRAIRKFIARLRSIRGRIELYEEISSENPVVVAIARGGMTGRRVFIVHGHDEAMKQSVARLVSDQGLEPIILHERPDAGRTIIEKFEQNSDVVFAVVLLTPDDEGRSKRDSTIPVNDRARQNVIFEHGYFIGKLGRERVCAVYVAKVELPSDMAGVLYIAYDANGAWKFQLAREMQNAGLPIDLNKVV
jgi:predicted nucleotide-binding protein